MEDSQIERLEQAEATAKLLAKEHAQVCPNCGQGVSRIDGCDHMTCKSPKSPSTIDDLELTTISKADVEWNGAISVALPLTI
jgi:hypothetical protein